MDTPLIEGITKEYLQNIIQNVNGMIFTFHKTDDGRFIHTFCEGKLLKKMNLTTEQIVGNELKAFMPQKSANAKGKLYERAWGGEAFSYEGFDRNVSYIVTLSPVRENGEVVQVIGTCIDIQDRKEKENDLEMNREHLKSFFTYNPDPIFSLDSNGYFTSVNEAGEIMTGHSENQMKKSTFLPYITPDYKANAITNFHRVMQGESLTFRSAIMNARDERIELRVTAVPIVVQGKIKGVYGIARNITEQLEYRAALEQSEERYRNLVENSPIAIAVNVNDQLRYTNPAFVKLFQARDRNELIGRSKWTLIPEQYHDCIATLEETLENLEFHYKRREGKILRLDDKQIDVEMTAMPIHFEGEKGILVMLSNISERKKIEKEVKRISQQNEMILNTAGDGILSITSDLTINFANLAALDLLGYEKEELIGQPVSLLFNPSKKLDKFDDSTKNWAVYKERNQWIQRKEEQPILADITITPILEDEERNGTVLVIKDITQQKKLDELMIRSDKLSVLGELAAGIAHEIRNPLTSLKGFIQLIQSITDNRYDDYCTIMLDELERVNGIVGEFLMLAKPQHSALSKANPTQLLQEVVSFLNSEAIMHNVNIHEDYSTDTASILAESSQLKQVFINLLKNAIESMEQGGNIYISIVEDSNNMVKITIQDEGCGIEEQRLKTLGQPFYTTKERGTGLGLMICYKIIEHHNGKLTFMSKLNVGTIVEILLPLEFSNESV
ncbi:PAS domain S-box protein [Pseudalkalibacillus sp. SCS-8]|uniref:PAS domain-containing protein n=1 Tax=Pseudalkalibacillus nanhaiensis TaxID=3115291 RepID=UPI0032DADA2C